jgi:hypothetical protein
MQNDSMRKRSIKEEMEEDDPSFMDQPRGSRTQQHKSGIKTQHLPQAAIHSSAGPTSGDDDPYESQFEITGNPNDAILKDELDAVVDKKFQKTFDTASKIIKDDDDDNDYADDDYEEKDELKQDTIKTDRIE